MESQHPESGFIIPSLKTEKILLQWKWCIYFYCGSCPINGHIFCMCVYMVCLFLVNLPVVLCNILFCVDSKAMIYALNSKDLKMRFDIIFEKKHLIHCIPIKGTVVDVCWPPSYCGLTFNKQADRPAKRRATNNQSIALNIPLSAEEACTAHLKKMYRIVKDLFREFLPSQFGFERCSKVCLELSFRTPS